MGKMMMIIILMMIGHGILIESQVCFVDVRVARLTLVREHVVIRVKFLIMYSRIPITQTFRGNRKRFYFIEKLYPLS